MAKQQCYILDGSETGTMRRVYQLLSMSLSIDAKTRGTWCAMFKSKGYLRAIEVRKKINERCHVLVKKEFPDAKSWGIEMLGSRRLTDVQERRRQRYVFKVVV